MSTAKGTKPKSGNSRSKRKTKQQDQQIAGCPTPVFDTGENPCKDGNPPSSGKKSDTAFS